MERTLSIIKPDGVEKNVIGEVISRFEKNGLRIAALKMVKLTKKDAEGFYIVHKERPFYGSLTDFMSRGPVVLMVLEGENAIAKNREIMGATNPAQAAEGTHIHAAAEFGGGVRDDGTEADARVGATPRQHPSVERPPQIHACKPGNETERLRPSGECALHPEQQAARSEC